MDFVLVRAILDLYCHEQSGGSEQRWGRTLSYQGKSDRRPHFKMKQDGVLAVNGAEALPFPRPDYVRRDILPGCFNTR